MNENWAAENLLVIRTLMERSALYRRALGPILLFLGLLGTAAGIVGPLAGILTPSGFIMYWEVIGVVAVAGCLLLARKQAMKDAEPFWSAPTRHVSQALLPPLFAGALAGLLVIAAPDVRSRELFAVFLPAAWMLLYGCALAFAGFFMRQGIRVLGWVFMLAGSVVLSAAVLSKEAYVLQEAHGHYLMGCTFGLLHLACAVYLRLNKDPRDSL